MDANDERLMEHTEKVVADMLKYVLAPNQMRADDSVEYVIIDESGVTSANAAKAIETTDEQPYVFTAPAMKMAAPATDNSFKEGLNDIELFLAQELYKIRAEYPMYAESTNSYLCDNCLTNAMQPTTGVNGLLANAATPMGNNWQFAMNNAVGDFGSTFGNAYRNNLPRTQTCIGELWNDEDEWPVVGNFSNRNKHLTNEPIADLERDANEEEESSEEEDTNAGSPPPLGQEHTQNQNVAGANNPYSDYSATSTVPPAATTAAVPFQLPQTALQQTHSTTTTTTAAFGVVHQQTSSSTTTNFVSNNLANAALSTTPAALYTQAVLAQQYWSTILKDAQQRQNSVQAQSPIMHYNSNGNNNNNINNHSNINAAIYERIAYAHLLQQQIIQQQQQAAIAALLQHQKIAIQNNIAAANANLFAQAANVIGSSCATAFANFSLASNDYARTSAASSTPMTTAAMNMHITPNLFADSTKNELSAYNNNNIRNNCTHTNSNISLDSLNLNVSDHDEHPIACPPGIISKVSQSSHD